jgi:hypothetical protein
MMTNLTEEEIIYLKAWIRNQKHQEEVEQYMDSVNIDEP